MESHVRPRWARRFPESSGKSMGICGCAAGVVGCGVVLLATTVFRDYGVALFIGVPLVMGIVVPLFHGMGARRSFGSMFAAAALAQMMLFGGMLVLGIEGFGCLVMATPLWLGIALIGTFIVFPLHRAMWRGAISARGFPVIGLMLVLLLPVSMGAEHAARWEPEIWKVTTAVEIAAPPAVVWEAVIAFPELPAPEDWVFKLGVAYPMRAEIAGSGVGAVRRCVFSTGAFVEPITVWEPGRLLAFDVAQSPPAMQERSLYDIHPAHLEGYLESKHGEFRLIDLGNGKTRLEGTTWYSNRMAPAWYWRMWSDEIIHRIHLRVLAQVKAVSEARARN